MSYIGLDIGTSGCKASVLAKTGEVLASAHAGYPLLFPQKGFVELDPDEIFEGVKEVLRKLSPVCGQVKALALSSFGEAFVLLDKFERPLHHFITYADNRCRGIDDVLIADMGAERIFDITGVYPNQSFSLCRLLWLQRHSPELLERAERIFFANDYYNFLLTGNGAVDAGTASKSLLYDIRTHDWSEEMLKRYQLPKQWFSPVRKVGSPLGKLRSSLAEELGLPADIMVYLGCHDQGSAALGGGAYRPGDVVIGEGSTESINVVADNRILKRARGLFQRKLCVEPFPVEGLYMVPASFLTYGNAVRWYIDTLERKGNDELPQGDALYSYLEENSADTELIFLPHLSEVNLMEPDCGIPGAFIGLTLGTKQGEFYRAVLQGINFESKMNFDMLSDMGISISRITAAGGLTKSDMFMQMKADILKAPIQTLRNAEAGIVGLCMISAVACGDCGDLKEAAEKFVVLGPMYRPQRDYSALFSAYRSVRKQLKKYRE